MNVEHHETLADVMVIIVQCTHQRVSASPLPVYLAPQAMVRLAATCRELHERLHPVCRVVLACCRAAAARCEPLGCFLKPLRVRVGSFIDPADATRLGYVERPPSPPYRATSPFWEERQFWEERRRVEIEVDVPCPKALMRACEHVSRVCPAPACLHFNPHYEIRNLPLLTDDMLLKCARRALSVHIGKSKITDAGVRELSCMRLSLGGYTNVTRAGLECLPTLNYIDYSHNSSEHPQTHAWIKRMMSEGLLSGTSCSFT
jgi:hypothetical protein